jgi:hypothetical protein
MFRDVRRASKPGWRLSRRQHSRNDPSDSRTILPFVTASKPSRFRRRAKTLAVELSIKEIWSLNRMYETEKNNTRRRNRDAILSRYEFDPSIFIVMIALLIQ